MSRWLWIVTIFAVVGGCAAKPAEDFKDVQQSLDSRGQYRVQWNQSSDDDAAAAKAVSELLAKPLTRESAVQIAVLNNPSLQATYEEIGVAQADLVQAGLLSNPVFSGDFKFTGGHATPHIELSVSQQFLSILQIPIRKKVAAAALTSAKLRVTQAVIDLAADTDAAFYDVQAAQQTLELRKTVEQSYSASAVASGELRKAGNISDLQLATEQAQYEQAKLDTLAAEADVTLAKAKLNALLGARDAPGWTIDSKLTALPAKEPDVISLEQQAIKERADLSALRVEGESAARQLGLAKWSWLSDAEAGVAAERERDGGWEVGPAITLPIPLFDQGQGARGKASAELRRIQQTHAAKIVEVRNDVRMAHTRLLAARSRAERYQNVLLPLRHKIVEQSQLHYNGMFIGLFELLAAKRDEVEAGREYLEALKDYWTARTELAKAVGSALPWTVSTTQPSVAQPKAHELHQH